MVNFEILCSDSRSAARTGVLTTPHGKVETPAFMPIGTAGAVKGITPEQLKQAGTNIILANTYHLLLRPGTEVVENSGGLHRFMAWDGPILTDSGGFQIFSLAGRAGRVPKDQTITSLVKVDDNGVEFTSHVDGAKIYLNAEIVTEIQNRLGADIITCFDHCTPFHCDQPELKKAVERTVRWARQCKQTHSRTDQMLFAIVQGSTDLSLRTHCASELVKMNFDGYCLGGLSVGESHEEMVKTVTHTTSLLPPEAPRYLMGVGTPADITAAVAAGVDMFDCVLPTRNGRNAFAFTENGPVRLRNSTYMDDPQPIEPRCRCYCCTNFTRAALRHFFNVGEMLGPILVSLHNLTFYQRLMAGIRQKIRSGEFVQPASKQLRK
jgi:queuine tRNA-ribosyltransferase